jgi:predicted dehydrogenase
MSKKVNIGFIGSGFARRVQAPGFMSTGKADLIGCSSPNNAEDFSKEFNMEFTTKDWRKVCEHESIDLVCITTPTSYHFEQALYAMECGKHVLCEKPFTLTVGQADQLREMAASSGKHCLIDHELRFSPPVRYIKDKLERYELGEIFYATANSNLTYRNNADHPYNWWSDKLRGGGCWGAIGSHLIDLLRHLVDEVTAAETILTTGYKKRRDKDGALHNVTSDDIASSILRFRSGASGSIFTSAASWYNSFDVMISGEKGTLKMDIDGNVYNWNETGKMQAIEVPLSERDKLIAKRIDDAGVTQNKFSKAFFYYADAIVEAILNDDVLPGAATFEDGYLTQLVLETGWKNS